MLEKIKSIVSEQLNISPDKITLESSIIDDLGADSLDVVELVMALEENFGVEIPDEEAEKISTIGDIVNYIESHKNA
ncbi:MAG: acyl carrier protein [Clostridia bacterium]|nr:acyl carrier protein [Clostridia bacterium]MBO7399147.1 acyl carrier protein [Clostridia bacterium]MBO7503920.1 acyl carrier protein [Clostridia bacterium]MBO7658149.1 acyl carrier protein [Clostridia bacterium]MBP5665567.1 acyl carrier protein [Clostridia bacterium]